MTFSTLILDTSVNISLYGMILVVLTPPIDELEKERCDSN